MIAALSLSLCLSGCASFGTRAPAREPVTRTLPPAPSYLRPEAVPPATVGKDLVVVAKERGKVIERQNKVIVKAKNLWNNTVRGIYSKSAVAKKRLFGN